MRSARIQLGRDTRAFTVVEVLVAAAILLVALLAILDIFPTSSTNVDEGGRITNAVALAQQTLEVVKNSSFPPAAGNCPGPVPTSFTCSLAVTLGGTAPNQLATITVTTTWRDSQRSGTVSLVSAITDPRP